MPGPIITENAADLIALLEAETDPRRRTILTELLIAKENAIARGAGRSALADALVTRERKRVGRQRSLISRLPANAPQRRIAEQVLDNMMQLQNLFEAQRRLLDGDASKRASR